MSTALEAWLAPLLLPAELAACDRAAIDGGTAGFALMERAAGHLARATLAALPSGPIAVLCGPGNNGGDGLLAAHYLHDAGREVRVVTTRDPAGYRGDAARARDRCALPLQAWQPELLHGVAGAIDALLGTGASGAPRGVEAEVVRALNATGIPVVACDLPTGVDGATGEVPGVAVNAMLTVTFHRPSPGHLIRPGKAQVGRLHIVDIGLPGATSTVKPRIGAVRDAVLRQLPRRSAGSHKFSAGAVVIAGGCPRYPGAAVLAARGAQRAGAGYVIAATSEPATAALHTRTPEVIAWPWPDDAAAAGSPGELGDWLRRRLSERGDAIVAGPGLGDGEEAAAIVTAAHASVLPLVLDADGLGPFAGAPQRLRRDAPLIITPHAGELGRLLGRTSAAVGAGRLAAAQEAASASGAVVILKGDDTIIADSSGRVAINDLPAPGLATAGTGDVLAGIVGALLAAGMPAFTAACAAVRLHARAGVAAAAACGGADGVVAWEVAEHLPGQRGAAPIA